MKKIVFLTMVLTVAVSSVSLAERPDIYRRGQLQECDGSNCGRFNLARPLPAPEGRYAPTVVGPHALNIDFGVWKPELSRQTGPAAAGQAGDFWNAVGVPWNNDHIEYNLRSARGELSPIEVRLLNLGGAWGNSNGMGVRSPMLDSFNYPQNNQGGNSQVSLHNVPPGNYNLYVYGHGTNPVYYGDYTLIVGNREQGLKMTSHGMDAVQNTVWVEGSQYVKFTNIQVGPQEDVHIVIRPGAQVTDNSGRTFADAMICGLQLIPVQIDDTPLPQEPSEEPRYVPTVSGLHALSIDFAATRDTVSKKTGPAAVGNQGDFWNSVHPVEGYDYTRDAEKIKDITKTGLKYTNGQPSDAAIRMVNLAGGYTAAYALNDPMFSSYNYQYDIQHGNNGGPAFIYISYLEPGTYDLYLYAPLGRFQVLVNGKPYGRKDNTQNERMIAGARTWVEGVQYQVFPNLKINRNDQIEIDLYPSNDPWGDSPISGLQVVPAGTPLMDGVIHGAQAKSYLENNDVYPTSSVRDGDEPKY